VLLRIWFNQMRHKFFEPRQRGIEFKECGDGTCVATVLQLNTVKGLTAALALLLADKDVAVDNLIHNWQGLTVPIRASELIG